MAQLNVDLVAAAPNDPPDLPSAEAAVPPSPASSAGAAKTEPRGAPRQLLDTTEAVVTPTSWVQGSTARTLRLRARYDTNLLAISRRGRPITTRLRDVPLFAGDVLLDASGPFGYSVRVVPRHDGLASVAEVGLVANAG